jgi:thymidine phosphorylase
LITASILSKKLAAGLDALVMDVKVGSGAFMPTLEKSQELARSIVEVGNGAGVKTSALLTDMNEPLAPCAGNAIEVRCAMDYLLGKSRPARLHEVTLALSAELLVTSGIVGSVADARQALAQSLESGRAAERFAKMVTELGGPADLLENPDKYLRHAPIVKPVVATRSGFVSACDTRRVGLVVVALGGGRMRAADAIDFDVGLTEIVSLGTRVNVGDPIAVVHARTEASANMAVQEFSQAITISDSAPVIFPLVQDLAHA